MAASGSIGDVISADGDMDAVPSSRKDEVRPTVLAANNEQAAGEDIEVGDRRMDPKIYGYATTSEVELQFQKIFPAKCVPISCGSRKISFPAEMETLIQASGNKVSPRGNTVLHLAAASVGHEKLVELILKRLPGLVGKQNNNGDLALHLAASAGHLSTVRCLLQNPNANKKLLNEKNGSGNTALHVALENRQQEVAKFLVGKDGSVSHSPNNDKKTPLGIAAEAGNHDLVKKMVLETPLVDDNTNSSFWEGLNGHSVLRAAIIGRNKDVVDTVLSKIDLGLINSTDEEGFTPLTVAANIGNLHAARCLINKSTDGIYKQDRNNLFPIHVASILGHIKIVEEFLNRCPDSRELLDSEERNILHVAAAHGRVKMVTYMLRTPELGMLANERDQNRNTPLHLAVQNWHPRIARILTRDKRVKFNILNNAGMTPLDVAEKAKVDKEMLFRWKLTFMALRLANASRSKETRDAKGTTTIENVAGETKNNSDYLLFSRENVNTLLLVATLVATITFAAGFTVPGGNDEGSPRQLDEYSTINKDVLFLTFVITNTIAMYSSITVSIGLIWAQTGDDNMIYAAMRFVLPMLGIALIMMSTAFLFGVALVVNNLFYCSYLVLIIGGSFICNITIFLAPLTVPFSTKNFITRSILHANFTLLMKVTRYDVDTD